MIAMRTLGRAVTMLVSVALVPAAPIVGVALSRSKETPRSIARAPADVPQDGGTLPAVANDFVGVLLPPQMANLSQRADGKILEVRIRAGRPVRTGEVIVAFDLRSIRKDLAIAEAQLKGARADAAAASADMAAARAKAARRTATIDVGGQRIPLVSGEEASQSRYEAQSAGARAASAAGRVAEHQAKVEQLRVALEESELRAPFDGIVSGVYFEPGMTAHAGEVVARVVGGRGLRARIAVPEEASGLLGAKRARLAFDDRTLMAGIEHVTPEPEPASRAFVVEGSVEGLNDTCNHGCAELAGRTVRASLVVP
jgi:multidrug efflux pump subunit AcrA (membrane-fusion protein)